MTMKNRIAIFSFIVCAQLVIANPCQGRTMNPHPGHANDMSNGYNPSRQVSDMTASNSFKLNDGQAVNITLSENEAPIVKTALEILGKDLKAVLNGSCHLNQSNGQIIIGTVGKNKHIGKLGVDLSGLSDKKEAFLITTLPDNRLLIAGSDSHGTAYGIMELSRLLGVSPWEWWADVRPARKQSFELEVGYKNVQHPSVEYRGIFINDEDWGLMPWSSKNYEPSARKGQIGPKTNARIFELLLRLRANTYWPAMHECTVPFFLTEGNREMAKRFGIYIGSSHCEPMACNAAGEWKIRGKGSYDYVNNSRAVYRFWKERVKEVADQDIIYTVGMRGIHDGQMLGAKTTEEQKATLEQVFKDQRRLLKRYVNKDITKVPQVFIPYKEIQAVYNAGLNVPEDVTLMWCDDNYGYIRHFPDDKERKRPGGNGVYYHVSYWGSPHDYLWLGTFNPSLLYQQMKLAYDKDIRKIWILNVGDIKPAEYQIELFMDMAWNIEQVERQGISGHLEHFLKREFGEETGHALCPVMQEYYRLAHIRKPEFMGNTRVYEKNRETIIDLPWSREYIQARLNDYTAISDKVENLAAKIPETRQDAYFQLIKYPVQASAEMNKKLLYAQYARHGKTGWEKSDAAYDSIVALTARYNKGITHSGKWNYIMNHQPRNLPVFKPVKHSSANDRFPEERLSLYEFNGTDFSAGKAVPYEGLGYDGKAVMMEEGEKLEFSFCDFQLDSVEIELRMLPTHPVDGHHLRVAVTFDGQDFGTLDFETAYHSEEWKQNVLTNQAKRRIRVPLQRGDTHKLVLKAIDEGLVLDQIFIYPTKTDSSTIHNPALYGKRIGFIGDSYVKNHREPVEYTWHYKFAKKYGMQYFNYGINGNCVSLPSKRYGKAMYKRYNEMDDSLDYVVVIGGHNDAFQLDSTNIDVYKDKLSILCSGLKKKYPSAKIFFFTCWKRKNFKGSVAEQIVDTTLETCRQYGIHVFDAARKGNIFAPDDHFRSLYFQSAGIKDTAHLNAKGHDRFLPCAEAFILKY